MANTLNLGDGNWGVKDSSLLGYAKDGTQFLPETFDVTRASSGTRVNKDGLIETPTEILSEELIPNGDFSSDTKWSKGSGWAIGGGSANCDGSQGGNTELKQQGGVIGSTLSFTIGKTYKVSFDVVVTSGLITYIEVASGFDQTDIKTSGSRTTYITATSTNNRFTIAANSTFVGSISNISVVEINQDNLARIDYTDGVEGVLLTEPQSTNLVTDSQDFSGWSKTSGVTTTSAYGISPSGLQDSTRIQLSTSNEQVYLSLGAHSGNTEVASLYIKGVSGETVQFGVGANVGQGSTIALNGNWQRITQESTSGSVLIIGSKDATTRDIQVWGAQVEELSYATSYIPTYGQIASRAADVVNNGGDVNNFNSEEGVLFAEIYPTFNSGTRQITINDGSYNNRIIIEIRDSGGTIRALIASGGVTQVDISYTASSLSSPYKVAIKYKLNDVSFWVNGLQIGSTDTSVTMPIGLEKLSLDGNNLNGLPFFGKTKNIQVFNTALTDAELITLTT